MTARPGKEAIGTTPDAASEACAAPGLRIGSAARRALVLVWLLSGPTAHADVLANLFESVSRRIPCVETTSFDWLRVRNEQVGTSNTAADSARGTTARLLLGLETRRAEAWSCEEPDPLATGPGRGWRDLSIGGELIGVVPLAPRDFRERRTDTASPYALINDPTYFNINQLYAQHTLGIIGMNLRVGRQKIALDNERFIGASDFRQIMQVYDGATASLTKPFGSDTLKAFGGYVARIRDPDGDQKRSRTWIANLQYDYRKLVKGTTYWYGQAQPESGQLDARLRDASNAIAGGRVDLSVPMVRLLPFANDSDDAGPVLRANVELARQTPYAGGDESVRASYRDLGLGITHPIRGLLRSVFGMDDALSGIQETFRYAHQVRGSNGGRYGFRTPLGTGHAFQGAADIFLETPSIGLRDNLWGFDMARNNWTAGFEHHRMHSDFGSFDLGREDDLFLAYVLTPHQEGWNEVELRIDYAHYREGDRTPLFSVANGSTADPFAHSTHKFWFTVTLRW